MIPETISETVSLSKPLTIAIAGATGFVGRQLVRELSAQGHRVIALSRSEIRELPPSATRRSADLFSATSTQEALRGADAAIYLVHSMLPSSSLFQGNFHDTDLLLADNFARACISNNVRQIVYLGGMVPEGFISQHLQSRFEVESIFQSAGKTHGIGVTVFRAGMIVGPGGSSFEMLKALVKRLPVMLLPRWTQRSTQAVFIDDVVRALCAAVKDPALSNQTLDLVNGESLTYESLLHRTAAALGLKRWTLKAPINSTGFSKLWVSLFSNSTYELVSPLIDSLLCDLPRSKTPALLQPLIQFQSFEGMIQETFRRAGTEIQPRPRRKIQQSRSVRSIQRLPSIPTRDCQWIAQEYMRWLPQIFRSLIRVETRKQDSTQKIQFKLAFLPFALLELQYVQGAFDQDRQKFHIVGGVLSKTTNTGWLEFRQVENKRYTLAAIHEFVPALPWWLYISTQALLHRWVMKRFGLHLEAVKSSEFRA